MNFINKMLCITALFAIGSVSARNQAARGRATTTKAPAKKPAPAPAPTQPAIQGQTYKQLHDNILRMSQGAVFMGNKLNDTFIQNTVAQANAADLGADGIKFLLQTARDKFAPFTGDDAKDLATLQQINVQIDNAL